MKSFEIIHTITSPYRIHMFNIMHEILTSKGINFHVHFMSDITSHRPDDWSASLQSINFNHSFWPDKGIKLFGNKWHFNPGIINHFKKKPSRRCPYWGTLGLTNNFNIIFYNKIHNQQNSMD